jgi:predicted metal-dependent RNase
MSSDRLFDDVREQVRKIVPSAVNITNIDFEGPLVVIYTKDLEAFSNNNDLVRQLAQGLRKRVAIRPDPSSLANPDEVEKQLRQIIPEEAEVVDIYFEEDDGEVFIEAMNPGLVIGKGGAVLNEIKKETGWSPKVVRAPPIQSKTVSEIRLLLRKTSEERKVFLRDVSKKLYRQKNNIEPFVRITFLGGFREVGRSMALLSTNESKILIDCGADPSGERKPFFGVPEFPLGQDEKKNPYIGLDAVIITHAHMDHCGILPTLYKYGYKGPVYCTPPTRDTMSLLLVDQLKVTAGENKKVDYSAEDVRETVKHRHLTRCQAHIPERRPHPWFRGLPLPHRRWPLQRRLHRRHEVREDLALQCHHQQVPQAGDAGHGVDVWRLPRHPAIACRCGNAAEERNGEDDGAQGPCRDPCLRGRPFPGGHARHRGAYAHRQG